MCAIQYVCFVFTVQEKNLFPKVKSQVKKVLKSEVLMTVKMFIVVVLSCHTI
jgi:hypothetical protein